MHCGQRDVLVAAAVTTDEVQVEQFIVVKTLGGRRLKLPPTVVLLSVFSTPPVEGRRGAVRDVVQEGGIDKVASDGTGIGWALIALDETASRHILRKTASRAGEEIAIRIGRNHRDIADVRVGQLEPEEVGRLGLDHRPGGQSAIGPVQELARRNRPASSIVDIFTREHLVRRM